MKKLIQLLLPALILMSVWNTLSSQCEPDPGCIDIGDPGEICPYRLPDGMVDEPYEAIITVIAPGEYELDSATVIEIAYLKLDSISNLPAGLSYASSGRFWADSAACVAITGTPEEEGEFSLSIYVTPWIYISEIILPYQQQEDDTSVVLTVLPAANLDPYQEGTFRILPAFPNPFTETLKIGFSTPVADRLDLEVYSILGKMVYSEGEMFNSGEGFFKFDGSSLKPGTYFYRINNSSETYTGKFIKVRK